METPTRENPPRRGPVPGPQTVRTNVMVEPYLVAWAKHRPGGFSQLVRRLLREEYDRVADPDTGQTRG